MHGDPPISLGQLRCFDACVRLGGLGRAAESIGLSQSAASEAVSGMETALATTLLLRHAGGSTPTASGQVVALRAGRLLARLQAALVALAPAGRNPLPALRMAQVRAHMAVARCGSFAAAAADLGISVPALQRAARGLESLLRMSLYRSHPGGRGVTPSGAELARQMALALAELAQARQELSDEAAAPLTLGILPLVPKRLLARLVARAAGGAGPALTVRENSAAVLLDHLRWGRVDAVLGALPMPAAADLAQEKLFADPWVIAARRGHKLCTGATPALLAACPWVVPTADLPRHAALHAGFAALPFPPRVWLETDSLGTMLAIIAETDCLTLLARSQLALDHAARLAELPAGAVGPARVVSLAQRADWLPTPGQRTLLEMLRGITREALGPVAAQAIVAP